ncbi:MAG: hypothetical protein K8L97_14985 [Anaerolineae bacterium]|nr:hypothetical protein [Anaerolineae bacterium]
MGKYRFSKIVVLIVLLATALVSPIRAQSETPSLSVTDQVSDGSVVIASVYSEGSGYVVIRNDGGGRGTPGPILGFTPVGPGWSYNVSVDLALDVATATLYASLHTDDPNDEGNTGTFDFGELGGTDSPVIVDDEALQVAFKAQVIAMDDQFVAEDNTVTLNDVVTDAPGWLVIHADAGGTFGAVLGQTQVRSGRNSNVSVEIASDGRTTVLWPMLHVDTGEAGVYEFGAVEGADGPVVANGAVAALPVWTEPHIRMSDQIAIPGDGSEAASPATVVVESVLSAGPGFLVIHQDAGGSFGGVAGFAAVGDGLNQDVEVVLDQGDVTAVLWPMLHVDTGVEGEYEFGTVEGADGPVIDSVGNVVAFPINAAPSLTMSTQELVDGTLTISSALIDAPGWIAIHSNNEGAPGPVITTYPLSAGVNSNVVIPVDADAAGSLVFPMLHYDTNEPGIYEFGAVEGADVPVFLAGNVVVAPLGLGVEALTAETLPDCSVTAAGQGVNRRGGPGTDAAVVGTLGAGESAVVTGQATSASGAVWWQLEDGSWVREDVVTASDAAACASVPAADGTYTPSAPASTGSEPASTPEPGS